MDAGSIGAVVMLKPKCRIAGNGCVVSVDWRDLGCYRGIAECFIEVDDLTRKNKALSEQLRLATAGREVGRRDTVPVDHKSGYCLVMGESIIRNFGTECSDMKVEFFPGIRMELY